MNQALAEKYFGERDPIGQKLLLHDGKYRIVGVIGNVKHDDLTIEAAPEMYVPYTQANPPTQTFVAIKHSVGVSVLSDQVRHAVATVAPDEVIYSVQTMNERLSRWFAPRTFSAV